MKILIVNYEFPPLGGGGGVATQILGKGLVKQGHTVHVLTTKMKGAPKVSIENGMTVFRVPVLFRNDLKTASTISMLTFPLLSIPKGLLLCIKHKYDVINTHFYAPSGPTGAVLSLFTRIPNALYVHGADVFDPTRMNKTPAGTGILSWMLRVSAKIQNLLSSGIACQSSNTLQNIRRYIKTKKPVTVIPLPFEKPLHPKTSRKELGLDPKKYYILSVGRAVKRKGYEYLIEALTMLPKSIHCLILGDGPEIPALTEQAKRLNVLNRVTFLGYVEKDEDKYKYYSACDLYVLSSVHEGMGIVVQEAMEFGMPMVATNFGGQVDLIQNGFNGILVDPKKPALLAEAMVTVYRDKKLQQKFRQNNTTIIKHYYVERVATQFLDYFKNCLKKK